MAEVETSKIYVVCSDEGRNGKTLFSRCYCDYLRLIGHEISIIDLDSPGGHLAGYFEEKSEIIDISRTQGQIAVFDKILSEPLSEYLIDLPSTHLQRFFAIIGEIGFVEEAHRLGYEFVVFYVVDRTPSSLAIAGDIRKTCGADQFIAVRGQMIGDFFADHRAAQLYGELEPDAVIKMPELERDSLPIVEARSFSFEEYHLGVLGDLPDFALDDLEEFWPDLVQQFRDLQFKIDMVDLKKHGFV